MKSMEQARTGEATLDLVAFSNPLAAEIFGLDLSLQLNENIICAIRDAWLQYPVLVIRGQTLTPERQLAFAGRFGALQRHTVTELLHPEYPDILVLSNTGRGGAAPSDNGGAYWHSDITYEDIPPMGSILHGLKVPPTDGDTLFADMTAAYETLDQATKSQIDGVNAIHSYRHRYQTMMDAGVRPQKTNEEMARWIEVSHPIARTHPETQKKAIYVNEGFTARVDGLVAEESSALLAKLYAHSISDQFIYRHHWQTGDVIMWDNRCTMHCATPYDPSYERSMHRATIRGSRPI